MFRDRQDAALQLADRLRDRPWVKPLVLGIPRGGVAIAAVLARELGAELDVVLARKLSAPNQPELALGAVSEEGDVFLNAFAEKRKSALAEHLARELETQRIEIERRQALFRAVKPHADVAGRSVIVTDDGIATGSTMIAALKVLQSKKPREVVVAVPVASPDRIGEVAKWCDEVICLLEPEEFGAVGEFYEDFSQLDDADVVEFLRPFAKKL
ncbi:MAG: phosphoribosyltransferase [Planctomycetes bacterium]|nr:phosphoribosyltransferase [Planctomycetota bacterium]